jgi:hypothetical protein
MAEEREQVEQEEERERADAPFDENPPVDPTSQQVGNSNARFFMPREEETEESEGEEGEAGEEEEESAAGGS